jgi:hypothetical protein
MFLMTHWSWLRVVRRGDGRLLVQFTAIANQSFEPTSRTAVQTCHLEFLGGIVLAVADR